MPDHGLVDLDAFYRDNSRLFYGLVFLTMAVAIPANFLFLRVDPALAFESNLDTLPFFVPPVLAIAISKRWAQWTAGLGLLALSVWWMFTFSSTLK